MSQLVLLWGLVSDTPGPMGIAVAIHGASALTSGPAL